MPQGMEFIPLCDSNTHEAILLELTDIVKTKTCIKVQAVRLILNISRLFIVKIFVKLVIHNGIYPNYFGTKY